MNNKYFIIDFDSTFVQVEALDELSKIVLNNRKDKEQIIRQIEEITKQGMEGKIPFEESLTRRLSLFRPNKTHLEKLIKKLKNKVTPSVRKNKLFFKTHTDSIYIISGGFKNYVIPVVEDFGIKESNILTNSFIFDNFGNVIGFDKNNPLSKSNGKTKIVRDLKLNGIVSIIGDGYTDYQVKEQGAANKFFAFIENVKRESVICKADYILASFDELILLLKKFSF